MKNYNDYYIVRVSLHQFEKSIPATAQKLRFYTDDLKESRFFNGSNFEDVIRMKLGYDDDYYCYRVDYIMHISL